MLKWMLGSMSSLEKGNEFEDRAFEAIASELRNQRLPISPRLAKLFRGKAYYSRDRQSSIRVDISIEMFLPDKEKPSLIWIFECKDYSRSIPVDDLEEFHAKIQQIGEDNTKGTIVTSSSFQQGALSYAKAKRIGVIRLLPEDQIDYVLEMISLTSTGRERNWSEFPAALTTPQHRSRERFFANQDGQWFANWYSLLNHLMSEREC